MKFLRVSGKQYGDHGFPLTGVLGILGALKLLLNLTWKLNNKILLLASCGRRTTWTWATRCKWFETSPPSWKTRRSRSKSIKWSEAIKGPQTTPLFLSRQRNIKETAPLNKNTTEIEEANHDELLWIASDHLIFSCQYCSPPTVVCAFHIFQYRLRLQTPLRKRKKPFPQLCQDQT